MRSGGSNCRPNCSRHAAAQGRLARKPGWQHPERESELHEPPTSSRSHRHHPGRAANRLQLFHRQRSLGLVVGSRVHASSRRQEGASIIRHANGIESSGEVVEVLPPKRIVFTYGFNSGKPMPPGGSRVTISLEPHGAGNAARAPARLCRGASARRARAGLALSAVASLATSSPTSSTPAPPTSSTRGLPHGRKRARIGDGRCWQRSQGRTFASTIATACSTASTIWCLHIGATQRFMPNLHLKRQGDVRHCQGALLVEWIAGRQRRSSARRRYQRVRAAGGRPHRVGDGVLGRNRAQGSRLKAQG